MQFLSNQLESYELNFINDNVLRLNLNETSGDSKGYYNLNKKTYENCYNSISNYNSVNPNNILLNNGSSEVIRSILHCVTFDKRIPVYGIVIPPTYEFTVKLMKAFNITICNTEMIDLITNIEQYKNQGVVIVYIDTPNNPTGYTWAYRDIENMLKKYPEVLFIIDEAYIEFSDEQSCSKLVLIYNNLIVTKTFSKVFSMADYRIGYLISNSRNVNHIKPFINPFSVTREAMKIATNRLTQELPLYLKKISTMKNIKKEFIHKCQNIDKISDIIYDGGNFVIIQFIPEYDSKNIYEKLLANNIVVRHKSSYQNGIRVSITNRTEMNEFIRKFINILYSVDSKL